MTATKTPIIKVNDTTFEQYQRNIMERTKQAQAAISGWPEPAAHGAATFQQIVANIEIEEFTRTRLPGILGLELLRTLDRVDYVICEDEKTSRAMFVHNTRGLDIPPSCVPVSHHQLMSTVYPRVGVETGQISSVEQFLFVFLKDTRLVSSVPALMGAAILDMNSPASIDNGSLLINGKEVDVVYPEHMFQAQAIENGHLIYHSLHSDQIQRIPLHEVNYYERR